MSRFFVDADQISDGAVHIYGEDVNHIRHVLRMRPGEEIQVSRGDEWEYTCEILPYENDREIVARIVDAQKPGRELPGQIYLFQCLPKSDKMNLIVQKAVELGVYAIVPVVSRRCVVKLDEKKAGAKVSRWNAVAQSAAKQSMRMIVPEVLPVRTLEEAFSLAEKEQTDVRLMPYESAEDMEFTRSLLGGIRPGQKIAVLIGPEGGFEDSEVQAGRDHGFSVITLGRRILRTETAGMTVLSILMYLLDS